MKLCNNSWVSCFPSRENFEKNTSIHLEEWPKSNKKLINLDLEEKMVGVREIVSKGLDERIKVKLAVKQPLAKVIITTPIELTKELEQPIMSELNVKAVEIKKGKELLVELDTKLTPELEQEGAAREIMRKINDLRKQLYNLVQIKLHRDAIQKLGSKYQSVELQ